MNSLKDERLKSIFDKANTVKGLLLYSIVLCGVIFGVQLAVSLLSNGVGFPLDDSWIHLTYARSLAEGRGWSYGLNPPSAGSTSVLWTLLLVPGFWLGESGFYIWTMGLSFVVYSVLTFCTLLLFKTRSGARIESTLFLGAIVALEWHLLWASGSGMETLLAALGYVAAFLLITAERPKFILVGMAVGALSAIRPDGITIIGPAVVVLVWKIVETKANWRSVIWLLLGLSILVLPMILHNYALAGSPFPNTLTAKVLEYSETLQLPFLTKAVRLLSVFITGVGAFLVPGFCYRLYFALKKKEIWSLTFFAWFFGFILIYIFRLPVNYQHGRYLIPLIPMFLFFGYWGTVEFFGKWKYSKIFHACVLVIGVAFATLGVKTYSNDVATINNLMVNPAKWVNESTKEGSLIAAHDIGALGFYGNREIVDLAGLIEPSVIPIIRDEAALVDFIHESNSEYLLVFSDWYGFTQGYQPEKSFIFGDGQSLKQVDIYRIK